MYEKNGWTVVYEKAIRDDGSLFFPEKLSHEFLENTKKTMGSYIFANQYLNEVIPKDKQTFKQEWLLYYNEVPKNVNRFIFVDPAISQADTADFTGIVVVAVDSDKRWFVEYSQRFKVTPTELIKILFEFNKRFNPRIIGIEEVAYQKALLYFLAEEMQRRNEMIPIQGVKPPTDKTKEMRILSLVPRFEFSRIFLNQGMTNLELELLKFPRGAHDDIIDALAGIEMIATPPPPEKQWERPPAPNHPDYERWYIDSLRKEGNHG